MVNSKFARCAGCETEMQASPALGPVSPLAGRTAAGLAVCPHRHRRGGKAAPE